MAKTLVAYFSASGVTAEKAKALAAAAQADLAEIRPAVPYTPADLKWTNPLARCNREWLRREVPALAGEIPDTASYDLIFLGFPIWYYTAPLIVWGFLHRCDLRGKRVVLFATSGGSDMKRVVKSLRPHAKGAELVVGEMLTDASPEQIRAFAGRFGA